MQKKKKMWVNHQGQEVPARYVPAIDKKKDRFARKTVRNAKALSLKLTDFKQAVILEAEELYRKMAEEANVDISTRKGNFTITSFDKNLKIEVNIQNRIEFDDNINLAQEKIKEFLTLKTKDVDADLGILVNSAFTTSKGRLDSKRILSLFALNIKHSIWISAMELIRKSIQTNHSTRYINIYQKSESGNYQLISLNFSSL